MAEADGLTGGGRAGFSAPDVDFAQRVQQLAQVTAQLAAAESMDDVVVSVVSHVAEAIGAAVTTLMVRAGDRLVLLGAQGVRAGVETEFAQFGVDDLNPASEAVRTGQPVMIASAEQVRQRYPVLGTSMPEGRSLLCLPLNAGGSTLGVVGLTFDESWVPGPREFDLLRTFADSCAQAVRRVRATEEIIEKARWLSFLADASAELASSLDHQTTLANVARLAVPELATWCSVDLVEQGRVTTLAVAHEDADKAAWAWQLRRRYPPDAADRRGAANVIRTGVAELVAEITDEVLVTAARDEEHLKLARSLDLRSSLIVPLSARGRILGAITMLRTSDHPPYTQADLVLAQDLARRAGTAIDNANLHRQAQDVALQLQRAILPADLSAVTGWQVAAHYSPGGRADVGGDFYDAVSLPDGRLALFIGDVMGHGIGAAAAMAQLRAAVRAFLSIDPDPAVVVGKLDTMFGLLGIEQLATLAYAVVDPASLCFRMVNAGHYPPLLVRPDGTASFAESPPQRPLGVGGDDRTAAGFGLVAGSALLFYTDGLVERRAEPIDRGLARLRAASRVLESGPIAEALGTLVETLRDPEGDDDVTALALRVQPATPT